MATFSHVVTNYIEISSDEESFEDEEILNGLAATTKPVVKELFENFIRRCALHGIREDNLCHVRTIFTKASSNFLTGKNFVSFLRAARERLQRSNAERLLTVVGQSLCTGKIIDFACLGHKYERPSHSDHETKADKRTNLHLDEAKHKLLDLISNQQIKNKKLDNNSKLTTAVNTSHTEGNITSTSSCVRPNCDSSLDTAPKLMLGQQQPTTQEIHQFKEREKHENFPLDTVQSKHTPSLEETNITHAAKAFTTTTSAELTEDANDGILLNDGRKGRGDHAYNGNVTYDGNDVGCDDDDVIIISVKQHATKQTVSSNNLLTNPIKQAIHSAKSNGLETDAHKKAKQRKKKLLIKSLKQRLEFYEKEIKRLMQAELTFDEMDSADSSYIKECKLKAKYAQVFEKLCRLQGVEECDNNETFSRIKIEGCPYPEINREAEKYVHKKKCFPDFFDIKKIVSITNRNYKLGLKSQEEVDIAREVFSEIGDKLQRKRKKEFVRFSGNYLTDEAKPENDPARLDHALKKKLKSNKKISKSKTEELFKRFSRMQYQGCDSDASSDEEEIAKTVIETQKRFASTSKSKRAKINSKEDFQQEDLVRSNIVPSLFNDVKQDFVKAVKSENSYSEQQGHNSFTPKDTFNSKLILSNSCSENAVTKDQEHGNDRVDGILEMNDKCVESHNIRILGSIQEEDHCGASAEQGANISPKKSTELLQIEIKNNDHQEPVDSVLLAKTNWKLEPSEKIKKFYRRIKPVAVKFNDICPFVSTTETDNKALATAGEKIGSLGNEEHILASRNVFDHLKHVDVSPVIVIDSDED